MLEEINTHLKRVSEQEAQNQEKEEKISNLKNDLSQVMKELDDIKITNAAISKKLDDANVNLTRKDKEINQLTEVYKLECFLLWRRR